MLSKSQLFLADIFTFFHQYSMLHTVANFTDIDCDKKGLSLEIYFR